MFIINRLAINFRTFLYILLTLLIAPPLRGLLSASFYSIMIGNVEEESYRWTGLWLADELTRVVPISSFDCRPFISGSAKKSRRKLRRDKERKVEDYCNLLFTFIETRSEIMVNGCQFSRELSGCRSCWISKL